MGAFAGVLSVYGYHKITPYLQRKFGLLDTCGVHNLHGMPALVAGVASAIVMAVSASVGRFACGP